MWTTLSSNISRSKFPENLTYVIYIYAVWQVWLYHVWYYWSFLSSLSRLFSSPCSLSLRFLRLWYTKYTNKKSDNDILIRSFLFPKYFSSQFNVLVISKVRILFFHFQAFLRFPFESTAFFYYLRLAKWNFVSLVIRLYPLRLSSLLSSVFVARNFLFVISNSFYFKRNTRPSLFSKWLHFSKLELALSEE